MADQVFNISCGFFDAVNHDRTYTAADMCMPYKRFVTDISPIKLLACSTLPTS